MERISKTALLIAGALYVIGLLAQNVVLATVGASDLLLLRARGIFIGMWVVLIFGIFALLPIWALSPWLLWRAERRKPSKVQRGLLCGVAVLLPATLLCLFDYFWCHETGFKNLRIDWFATFRVTAFAALAAASGVILWKERRVAPRKWARLAGLGVLTAALASIYVEQSSFEIVMLIPASYGGARAQLVRLVVRPEVGRILFASGVQFMALDPKIATILKVAAVPDTDQNVLVTKPMKLIDEGESDITVVLPLANGQRQYFSSLDIKRSDLVAVISEPSSGSADDKRNWAGTGTWPPQ